MAVQVSSPSLELLNKVHNYLRGAVSLGELEEWLVPYLGYFLAGSQTTASDLAGTVELGLAELSDGLITEEEFKRALEEFFFVHTNMVISLGDPVVETGANNSALPPTEVSFGSTETIVPQPLRI